MGTAWMHWTGGWITGLSQMAAGAFVASLWQGLVLATAVWACLRMLPRMTAAVRFSAWTAVFAAVAVLPFFHLDSGRATQALAAHSAMLRLDSRWTFVIAGLWAMLSLVRAARLVVSGLRLHGIWKRATPVPMPSSAAGIDMRKATLCISCNVDRPSVIGFFSPRILVPEDLFGKLTDSELEQIVLHEMGHLRRKDDWINLAQKIGLVLFPLNPILVWIERRLCFERELACDDDVLRLTRAPKAYARCLTNLAEHRLERQSAALSLGAWERRSELGERVHSILRNSKSMGRIQSRVVFGVLLLALSGGATELARCPRIVSFAGAEPVTQLTAPPLPEEYHPVVATEQSAAHETLLRASMPTSSTSAASAIHRPRKISASRPVPQRASKTRSQHTVVQQWVVMTSWSSTGNSGSTRVSRMVFTVPDEREVVPTYAALPTPDGWLVLQL